MAVNEKETIKQKITVTNPRLWSLEDPYLYRVVSVIKSGRQNSRYCETTDLAYGHCDLMERRVFSEWKTCKDTRAPIITRTMQVLEAHCPITCNIIGSGLLKNMGVNAYRTSHNPPTPELLDACDSLGMLVLDENRLLNSSPEYMNQFERLIMRDRNHPSVFLWSIGNEEGWIQTNSIGKRIAQTLLAKQKELDPTRTSTYAADVANVYHGVNEVIPVRGFNYRQFGVADYHQDHPNQPIIGTEMGSTVTTRGIYEKDTIRGYVPDQDITAPWWASTAETLVETGGRQILIGWVDLCGQVLIIAVSQLPINGPISIRILVSWICVVFPKIFITIINHGGPIKMYCIFLHIGTGKIKEGKPIDVWVNTNADNVELFLNGKSLGKKDMPRNSHLQWTVNYEPGTLEAVAYKKGKKINCKSRNNRRSLLK